jgi:AAHS family 4-hydroxybenzoate transporter-like MFS transporter
MSLSLLPSLLSARGINLAGASHGLAAYNYGGVLGVLSFAALVNRLGSRILTLTATLMAAVTAVLLMTIEIKQSASPVRLLGALAAHGFCVNALQTSLFALGVYLYPTRVRSRGVAIASGMTRVGGIVSASLGAWIIQQGQTPFFEYLTAAMLLALVGMIVLRNHIPAVNAKEDVRLARAL